MSETLVIAAGDVPDAVAARCLGFDVVITADGGVATARRLGLDVAEVVGDLDSASAADVAWAREHGATIVEHPSDKDATDLELALDRAVAASGGGQSRLVVVGVEGGRTDHVIGNWSVISGVAERAPIEVWTESATVHVVVDRFEADLEPGTVVSLLPWGAPAVGVTTSGLRWALADAVLYPTGSHGVSNVAVASPIGVSVERGTLLVALAAAG